MEACSTPKTATRSLIVLGQPYLVAVMGRGVRMASPPNQCSNATRTW